MLGWCDSAVLTCCHSPLSLVLTAASTRRLPTHSQVTSVVVSHDSGFLDSVCSSIIHYEDNFKLKKYLGNLSAFVKQRPEAAAYYNLADATTKWVLPEPGYLEVRSALRCGRGWGWEDGGGWLWWVAALLLLLMLLLCAYPPSSPLATLPDLAPPWPLPHPPSQQGVTSKDRAILKMRQVNFKYPTAETRILNNVNTQVSLNSRVAVLGPNGAGKSTLIKVRIRSEWLAAAACWVLHGCQQECTAAPAAHPHPSTLTYRSPTHFTPTAAHR